MSDKLLFAGVGSNAIFSSCRTWRYQLDRCWIADAPTLVFIGLNPSTADETMDDPTIRRCISFAKRDGFGRCVMLNLFGYRSTDPRRLHTTTDPVGPDNDSTITSCVNEAATVVVAWGAHSHPMIKSRSEAVLRLIDRPKCLGLTKGGSPKHPLYVPGNQPFLEYSPKTQN